MDISILKTATERAELPVSHNGWRIGEIRRALLEWASCPFVGYTLDGAIAEFVDRETGERFRVTVETVRDEGEAA